MTWLRNHDPQYVCYYYRNRIPHLGWGSADFVHCFDQGFLQAQEDWGGIVEVRGEKNTRTVNCLHFFFFWGGGGGGVTKFYSGIILRPNEVIEAGEGRGLQPNELGYWASTPPAWDTFVFCICLINRGTVHIYIVKGKTKHEITNKASNAGYHIWG